MFLYIISILLFFVNMMVLKFTAAVDTCGSHWSYVLLWADCVVFFYGQTVLYPFPSR